MPSILTIFRIGFAALALTAICRQLVLHVDASYSILNFFSYFTNLSNLIAALVLLLCAFRIPLRSKTTLNFARYVAVVNMTLVGLVYVLLLRNVDLGALLPWINIVLHYVMPVFILIDWLVNPPAQKLQLRSLFLALILPIVYLVYVLLRGATTGWYPYPFLNPANTSGYGGVAMYSLAITIAFMLTSWLLLSIGNFRASARLHNADI